MANMTGGVGARTTPFETTIIKRGAVSTAQTYHPGAMIAINGTGYATKCDDTAGLLFDGILTDQRPITVDSGGSNGDTKLNVDKPRLFTAKIAAAVVTDVGRKVYALYDDEVGFSTSASILVGTVEAYIDATHVEVRPYWMTTSGVVGFDGNTLTFSGATGVNVAAIPDNLADALSVSEGSNAYLTFKTTNGSETIFAKKLVDALAGINFSGATTANVLTIPDNLADALNVKEASNSYLKFVTTNGTESIVLGKAATGVSLAVTAGLTSSGPTGAGIGYATGAGGTVTQITNRSTGVTLSKLTGTITTDTTSLAAGAEAEFVVTNTTVAATDTVVVSLASGNTGVGTCIPVVSAVGAGSFKILITNQHASTAETGACVLNFAVFKGVAA